MNRDATPSWLGPHDGLSATDLQRIGAAVSAARAGSTRKVDANLWRQRERWCHAREIERLSHGVAPVRQARPLTPSDLRQILRTIDRGIPLGARDAAIILLGYAS